MTGRLNPYPDNLNFKNFAEFLLLPTLVYELEYPRSDHIDWYYVAEKAIAVVGILSVMNLVSQTFIYPVVMRTISMKQSGMPLRQRLEAFPWIYSDLSKAPLSTDSVIHTNESTVMPFMAEYMLVGWFLSYLCPALAALKPSYVPY